MCLFLRKIPVSVNNQSVLLYKELDLDTDEKRSKFLQFNYKEPKIDYSKFIKITKVTTETK